MYYCTKSLTTWCPRLNPVAVLTTTYRPYQKENAWCTVAARLNFKMEKSRRVGDHSP